MTRPTLMSYTATRDELVHSCGRLFEMVGSGKVAERRGVELRTEVA